MTIIFRYCPLAEKERSWISLLLGGCGPFGKYYKEKEE